MKTHQWIVVLIVLGPLGAGATARADVIRHFSDGTAPGRFPAVTALLNQVGIGGNNVASETTATSFFVPGSGPIDLTFKFEADQGTFLFSFGFYDLALVTADPITDTRNYAVQALSSSNATLVFDDRLVNPGAQATFTVEGGTELGFFLIPNNTLAFFQANPDLFYPPQTSNNALRAPLFSVSEANPGGFDQMLSFVANDVTLFTWEDLSRAGPSNNSFVDMAFTINAALLPNDGVIPEPSSLTLIALGVPVLCAAVWRRRRGRLSLAS